MKGMDVKTLDKIEIESSSDFSGGGVFLSEGVLTKADIAASYETAIVDTLIEKLLLAAKSKNLSKIAVCGGVAANKYLRSTLFALKDMQVYIPSPVFCTDNAAMIGASAYFNLKNKNFAGLSLNATPYISLGENLCGNM